MKAIEVLEDRLIVKLTEPETITASGIVLPDHATVEVQQQGVVFATGTDVDERLKPGVSVICSKYGGTEIEIDGEQFLVIKQPDVLVVLPEEKP